MQNGRRPSPPTGGACSSSLERDALPPFPFRSIRATDFAFTLLTASDARPIYGGRAAKLPPPASTGIAHGHSTPRQVRVLHRRVHRRDREGRSRDAEQAAAAGAAAQQARIG